MRDDKANRKTDLRRAMKHQTLARLNEDLYFISDVIGLDKGIS